MKIIGFVWLEDIVEELEQKHQVRQHEVREVFANLPRFRYVEKGHRSGENVYATLGRTDSGRYFIVFFVYRKDKQAPIVSARDMTQSERRRYEKRLEFYFKGTLLQRDWRVLG